jgi:hypothetical protein
MRPVLPCIVAIALLGATQAISAQEGDRYARCRQEAREVSGYVGETSKGVLAGAMKGGMGGAAAGAAGGWVVGGKAGKSAKRGAAVGALLGAAKAASVKRKEAEARDLYERVFDSCMTRDGS